MSKSSIEFIRHIYEEATFLENHSSGLTLDRLMNDEVLKRATVRSIEIIGEASKKVDDEFRTTYSDIEWQAMAKMRDKLIHHYFGVDYEIVLDVVLNKIPELVFQIEKILGEP